MARKNKKAVADDSQDTATTPAAKTICLVQDCGREAKIRGLCSRCCTAARKAIKDGKTTWADLESLGLAKAPTHAPQGVFSDAFKKALGARSES